MKKTKGFTLIELMIVVAIIGILAAIAIPKFADLIRKANEGATKGGLSSLRSAISIYYSENEGMYPVTGLAALTANRKYMDALPWCNVNGTGVHTHSKSRETAEFNTLALAQAACSGYWNYVDNDAADIDWGKAIVGCIGPDTRSSLWIYY